jgi:molybdopterin-guanine dinucleotide biosynthesis protein A
MGQDKALIELEGAPLAVRVADALRDAGARSVVALGGDARALATLGLTVVADEDPGAGPLAAVAAALHASEHPVVLAVACDHLAPDPEAMVATVAALGPDGRAADVAVPVVAGHRQWAHAAWSVDACRGLDAALAAGVRSMHRAAAGLRVVEVTGVDPAALEDADAPGDLPSGALRRPGPPVGEG